MRWLEFTTSQIGNDVNDKWLLNVVKDFIKIERTSGHIYEIDGLENIAQDTQKSGPKRDMTT
jgi:hypothetical protein